MKKLADQLKPKMDAMKTQGLTRNFNGNVTCMPIKALLPEQGTLPDMTIVHSRSLKTVQGYYIGGTPLASQQRIWEGPQEKRTELTALTTIVDWIWDQHVKKDNPDRRPNSEAIAEASRI